ncbi:MAG: MFS transporter [Deltaproteobacteria bacterium]|nr:MAG: MFS transporter [Deltaproteobacteria bacterium]
MSTRGAGSRSAPDFHKVSTRGSARGTGGGLQTTRVAAGIFYGWWIVAASFLILLITVGIGLYVPPVFLVPLQDHFGWSRAGIAAGSALAAAAAGAFSPLVGVWIDRYGSRKVMTVGALVMGGAFASFGLVQSLWQFYAINIVAAGGISCVAWIPNQTLIANWFERKRGLAMGIALAGIGFGGLSMAPFADFLIGRLGWRMAFAALASLVLVVVVGVIAALVRTQPADLGLRPDGEPSVAPGTGAGDEPAAGDGDPRNGLTLAASLRTGAFWLLSTCNLLAMFASMSVIVHLVAFLRDAGFESGAAATALGLTIGASVAGRVVFGYLADRFAKRAIMAAAMLVYGAASACLLGIHAPAALPAFVVLFGMGLGGAAVLVPLLVGECFGLEAFGRILGLIMISATLGAAVGPVLTGRIFDVTGSYQSAFFVHIGCFCAAALVIASLRTPRRG